MMFLGLSFHPAFHHLDVFNRRNIFAHNHNLCNCHNPSSLFPRSRLAQRNKLVHNRNQCNRHTPSLMFPQLWFARRNIFDHNHNHCNLHTAPLLIPQFCRNIVVCNRNQCNRYIYHSLGHRPHSLFQKLLIKIAHPLRGTSPDQIDPHLLLAHSMVYCSILFSTNMSRSSMPTWLGWATGLFGEFLKFTRRQLRYHLVLGPFHQCLLLMCLKSISHRRSPKLIRSLIGLLAWFFLSSLDGLINQQTLIVFARHPNTYFWPHSKFGAE